MFYLRCNGNRMAVRQQGSGPDLILLHGLGASSSSWDGGLLRQLKRHFRVTLYDLRGHGCSDRSEAGYGTQDMALDLQELMDQLEIDSAHLLGHCYGGAIALEMAVLDARRVTSLSLLDAKINRLQQEQRLDDSEHVSELQRALLASDDHDWAEERHIGLKSLKTLAHLRLMDGAPRIGVPLMPFASDAAGLRAARQYLELLDNTRAEGEFMMQGASCEELRALKLPLLLMCGEFSRCLPSARQMLDLQPQARFAIVPEAGHFFPATHPEQLMRELHGFLQLDAHGRRFAPAELLRSAS